MDRLVEFQFLHLREELNEELKKLKTENELMQLKKENEEIKKLKRKSEKIKKLMKGEILIMTSANFKIFGWGGWRPYLRPDLHLISSFVLRSISLRPDLFFSVPDLRACS